MKPLKYYGLRLLFAVIFVVGVYMYGDDAFELLWEASGKFLENILPHHSY